MDPCTTARHYAERVRDGKIPAGKWHRLACERHLRDLDRWGSHADGNFGKGRSRSKAGSGRWYFNEAKALHAVNFIERCCRHVKTGLHTRRGERVKLEPWQLFVVTSLFGWLESKTHLRRFRIFYWEMGRKNGKSFLLSCIALYCFLTDGVEGAECYSAGRTYKQAAIVWKAAKQMLPLSRVLNRRVGPHRSQALSLPDGSIFTPVHSDALSQEGLDPNFTCIDELHAHPTPDLWNVFVDAMGARPQPLLGAITTAGSNVDGVCFEQRLYVQDFLDGSTEDDRYLGFIFAADADDDWEDPLVWRKANPNLGVSVALDALEHDARLARSSAQKLADFKTKHLCQWVGAGEPFFELDKFDKGADPTLTPEQFVGRRCWMAVDLAARYDIAGFDILFEREDGHVVDFHRAYLPSAVMEPGGRLAAYRSNLLNWKGRGELELTEGDVIDHNKIAADLRAASDMFHPEAIAFDPYTPQMMIQLQQEGYPVIEVKQSTQTFSPSMKDLYALMLEGKYHHPGNRLARWSFANVHAKIDHNENVFPRKEKRGSANKIDLAVMTLLSNNRRMTQQTTYFKGGVTSA